MAEWTYTACNLEGEECGHDHRTPESVARCLPALEAPVIVLARNRADRFRGRPRLFAVMPEKPPRLWKCPTNLKP